jgi:catechol 2,3-dioxygenase-like lactoylglutathione lyase family enzyme
MGAVQSSERNAFPRTAEQRGRIAPRKFAHVVYLTSNFEALVDWYERVFEAQPVFREENICFLTYDDEHHRIAIIRAPGLAARAPNTAGVHHVAYTFATLVDLLATYERLKASDILPSWAINHGPTISFYYRDPDGNQMEFQIENFGSVEESAAYFFTKDFAENPIGVEFDPEDLLKRFRAGEREDVLKRRPAGPISPIR